MTLQAPSYIPFLTYSSDRALKEQLWRASNSRALGGAYDNTEVIRKIVDTRLKIANLLGYKNYADYVLENRMAENTPTVQNFLQELLTATKSHADADYKRVNDYAASLGFEGALMPWDWAYYSQKYKDAHYSLNDELIKPYLQLENVKKGVFLLANKLYGLNFTPNPDIEVYHPDVTAYDVTDAEGRFMAVLYLDFFPRETKRAGAWMTEFRGAKTVDGKEVRPHVSLVMNFTKPTETEPSLLTFDELETFLHEFGHALHGMLGEGTYESLTGTSVYRDFVELPSQIMENWATEKEFLDLWAVHYKTGEPIPAEIVDRIIAAKNYLAAYANVRQLSFGMTDMAWHTLTEPFTGMSPRSNSRQWPLRRCCQWSRVRRCRRHSPTSLRAAMRPDTMVTSGPRCWRPMRSLCSKRRASSIPRCQGRFVSTSFRRAVRSIRWNSTCGSAVTSPKRRP